MSSCPKCGEDMIDMGYGDEECPSCGHVEYTESEADFSSRIHRWPPEDQEDESNL